MTLDDVALLIVIGKGGVGRSTVAAAVAERTAAAGGKVLLVDAIAAGGAAIALGLDESPSRGVTTLLSSPGDPGALHLLELGTEASLDEYVKLNLPVPIAPSSLGPLARMFDYVATAAPAVREILTIGKIGWEVRDGDWDLVVVDGPATGHVIELLSAPTELGELVGFGPLASETAWLGDLLADRSTAALAVTLLEELPVTETIELVARLETETSTALAGVLANRVPPGIGAEGRTEGTALVERGGPLAELAAIALDRTRVAEAQQARLAAAGLAIVEAAERLDDPVAAVADALDGVGAW